MSGQHTRSMAGQPSRTGGRRLPQRGLNGLAELLHAEGALEPGGDPAVAVDREKPRLGLQAERLQRRPQALADLVVAVDLLMDEGHAVAVLLLHLQRDVDDGTADSRLAQLRGVE